MSYLSVQSYTEEHSTLYTADCLIRCTGGKQEIVQLVIGLVLVRKQRSA